MNSILKNTTLALLTLGFTACILGEPPPNSSSTTDDGMEPATSVPTENMVEPVPMHFACYNDSNYQVNAGAASTISS